MKSVVMMMNKMIIIVMCLIIISLTITTTLQGKQIRELKEDVVTFIELQYEFNSNQQQFNEIQLEMNKITGEHIYNENSD